MKTEPAVFSFDDLKARPRKTDHWEGVRNYQARNYLRDDMRKGDPVLFYHSNCAEPGVVGIAEVSREAYPDHFQWDRASRYFDPKSSRDDPRWFMVDVRWKSDFGRTVTLKELRSVPKLKHMSVLQKGQRLSVMPVTKEEFDTVVGLGMRRER